MRSVRLSAALSAVLFAAVAARAATPLKIVRRPPGTIAFTTGPGMIHTMNGTATVSAIQITNGTITSLSNGPVSNPTPLPPGAAIYPGFIDSHSHAISLLSAQATDSKGQPYWRSLANVNVMQLPPCPPSDKPPLGSTTCFLPVTSQDEVTYILKNAPPRAGWILGWNYEPSRLTCLVGGMVRYGFQCQGIFENQNQGPVVQAMNRINSSVPMLVTSESGHIVYVNSKALTALNICGGVSNTPDLPDCYQPVINPTNEIALAKTGQLDEDLALYAISRIEGILAADYASAATTAKEKEVKTLDFYAKQIDSALALYSALGYTTVQEGAASYKLVDIYMLAVAAMAAQTPPRYLPATMALLEYDMTLPPNAPPVQPGHSAPSLTFAESVQRAVSSQKAMTASKYDMFMAGMKVYSDGSTQGYTGDMRPGMYQNLFNPFINPAIFTQPYHGLPDYDRKAVASSAKAAHDGALPLWVHTNGPEAQDNVVSALVEQQSATYRDVIVHFAMPAKAQVDILPKDKIGVTFLSNDFYYFYQPLCEEVLTAETTANLYPAAWAQQHGLRFGLHSDVSVTPPSPLFGMWVATTRSVQKPAWLPKLLSTCTAAGTNQKIDLFQAIKAYTSDAAWLYGRNTTTPATGPGRGSLQLGFAGDLVILSADPLAPNADLSKIYVLYTVHNGNIVYPVGGGGWAKKGPTWPQ